MRRVALFVLLSFGFVFPLTAAPELPSTRYKLAAPGEAATLTVPAIDAAKALAQDRASDKHGARRYALGTAVQAAAQAGAKTAAGKWTTLPDGSVLWRFDVRAPGALAVDLGFSAMFLPQGAALYIASADGREVRGPYTDADNTRSGEFWTPLVNGAGARIELLVPAALQQYARLELAVVHSAYRMPFLGDGGLAGAGKSLNCHIDVACADADPYRAQVRATAGYTLNGPSNNGVNCTGTLLNNVARDQRRLVLSANHCGVAANANSVVLYWQYESPTCRAQGSVANGTPVPQSVAIAQTGGVTVRGDYPGSDSTLFELNTLIPAAVNEYYAGWDRRDEINALPGSTAVIHHSAGEEKRISFDNNSPVVNDGPLTLDTISYVAGASMSVTYDRGTTEGGSSGGGLFSQSGLLVGQLGGGPRGQCEIGITDAYGRISRGWAGGGTPATSLQPWLAPGNTTIQTLNGKDSCVEPTINLTSNTAAGTAGTDIVFNAAITGSGPFTVAWDVDNDGLVDRTATGITTAAELRVAYPTATSTTVSATVTDSTGCVGQAQRAINVSAPDIIFTPGTKQQVCGDGDAAIEPGEQWRVPFTLRNDGGATLDGGYAVFSTSGGATAGAGTVDSFGYRLLDSTGTGCAFQAIPVSAGVAAQDLIATDNSFPASDDGHTLPLALGPQGVDLYGDRVNQLLMSTNGYLTADLSDDGGAFQHSCPDDFSPDTLLGALHQDLVVLSNGGLYREYFATCPRAGDAGSGPRGCTVFTWRHMTHLLAGTGGNTEGDFSFQAIVYDGTYQIVYQYLDSSPDTGSGAAIGLIDTPSGANSQYGCDQGNRAVAGRAVCFFHPSAQPASATPAKLNFDPPAVPVNNLASSQTQNTAVTFYVPPDVACGTPLTARYVGTVDRNAYSLRTAPLFAATTIGNGGACQVANCAALPLPGLVPKDGLYSSFVRFGNGMAAYNIPVGGGTVFGAQWFTGERDRKPTWYTLQGNVTGRQADVPIYRFAQTGTQPFAAAGEIVGQGQVSYASASEIVLTWNIEGVAGGERMTWLYGATRPTPERTGAWVYGPDAAPEIGWGAAMDDHVLNGTNDKVIINYIFDGQGRPVWTLGASAQQVTGTSEQATFAVHCPTCPNLSDFFNTRQVAGTVAFNLTALTRGTYSTQLTLPPPLSGTWNRTTQPWQMITQPVPQQ